MRRLDAMRARATTRLRPTAVVLVRRAPVPILISRGGRRRRRGRWLVRVALALCPGEVGVDVLGVPLLESDSDDPLHADGLLLVRRAKCMVVVPWRAWGVVAAIGVRLAIGVLVGVRPLVLRAAVGAAVVVLRQVTLLERDVGLPGQLAREAAREVAPLPRHLLCLLHLPLHLRLHLRLRLHTRLVVGGRPVRARLQPHARLHVLRPGLPAHAVLVDEIRQHGRLALLHRQVLREVGVRLMLLRVFGLLLGHALGVALLGVLRVLLEARKV
mmetsp:Transcript_40601/g.97313  ORF Transcript_40601/g.97313 Transcript_40601/m.97313 type:complete len:271 (-) Transcript_40601:1084-1896(-)